jgi:hypothetical protein
MQNGVFNKKFTLKILELVSCVIRVTFASHETGWFGILKALRHFTESRR